MDKVVYLVWPVVPVETKRRPTMLATERAALVERNMVLRIEEGPCARLFSANGALKILLLSCMDTRPIKLLRIEATRVQLGREHKRAYFSHVVYLQPSRLQTDKVTPINSTVNSQNDITHLLILITFVILERAKARPIPMHLSLSNRTSSKHRSSLRRPVWAPFAADLLAILRQHRSSPDKLRR